jgi:hypothetical protein
VENNTKTQVTSKPANSDLSKRPLLQLVLALPFIGSIGNLIFAMSSGGTGAV